MNTKKLTTISGVFAKPLLRIAAITSLAFLTGCGGPPSINLVGSFFPGWMLCMGIGVVLSLLVRQLFVKINIDQYLPLPVLIYTCLWSTVTLVLWLLFFRS